MILSRGSVDLPQRAFSTHTDRCFLKLSFIQPRRRVWRDAVAAEAAAEAGPAAGAGPAAEAGAAAEAGPAAEAGSAASTTTKGKGRARGKRPRRAKKAEKVGQKTPTQPPAHQEEE